MFEPARLPHHPTIVIVVVENFVIDDELTCFDGFEAGLSVVDLDRQGVKVDSVHGQIEPLLHLVVPLLLVPIWILLCGWVKHV